MWWLVAVGGCFGGAIGYFGGPAILADLGWVDDVFSVAAGVGCGLLVGCFGASAGAVIGGAWVPREEWGRRSLGRKVRTGLLVVGSPAVAIGLTLGFTFSVILLLSTVSSPVFDAVAVAQALLTPAAAVAGSTAGGLWSGGGMGRRVAAALASGAFAFVVYAASLGVATWVINTYLMEYF